MARKEQRERQHRERHGGEEGAFAPNEHRQPLYDHVSAAVTPQLNKSTIEAIPRKVGDRCRWPELIGYTAFRRRRSALVMTETELSDMAAAAIIGLSRSPNQG
jgi:hypothetical protein